MEDPPTPPSASSVLDAIYAAALDRDEWPRALDRLRGLADLAGALLMGVDRRTGAITFSSTAGVDPEAEERYLGGYCAIDPRIGFLLAKPHPYDWMFDHEMLSDAFVERDRFYQELVIPAGLRYAAGTKVYQDEEVAVLLGVFRSAEHGPVRREDAQALAEWLPHLGRAVALSLRHFRFAAQALVGVEMLDRLRHPVFLLGSGRRIVHRNAAARRALAAATHLREQDGMLGCVHPGDARTLHAQIDAVTEAQIAGNDTPVRVLSLGNDGGRPLKGCLISLLPRAAMGVSGPSPLIMAAFSNRREAEADPAFAMAAWGLTRSEALVAAAIARGLRPAEAAAALGRSESTVRSQLKAVFAKMQVHSLSEMVVELLSAPDLGMAPSADRSGAMDPPGHLRES